jgi:sugar/nucleoside kinase (ribokinase family)
MAASPKRSIVVCGHLCVDIIPGFPQVEGVTDWFRPGRLSIVGQAVISTGGAVSNVGLSLHRLGLPVRLVARIGDDPLGRLIVERVSGMSAGLARDIAPVPGEVTSYTVVLNPPGMDRIFLHCPGANDTFTDRDVSDSVLESAAVLHFGYPPLMHAVWSDGGERLARLFARARAKGALTSLDMSLPDPKSPSGRVDWGAFLAGVLPNVDLFVPSVEELLFMVDRPGFDRYSARGGGEAIVREIGFNDLARLADWALAKGVKAVMIKMGERGAYLRTGPNGISGLEGWASRELSTNVFEVPEVAGTTGAGDATIAGFIGGVFKGLRPEAALSIAVAVGGCCVEKPDATSGIRTWDETQERIEAGWKRKEARITESGWAPAGPGLWKGPGDR